jgi:hypothetical protein
VTKKLLLRLYDKVDRVRGQTAGSGLLMNREVSLVRWFLVGDRCRLRLREFLGRRFTLRVIRPRNGYYIARPASHLFRQLGLYEAPVIDTADWLRHGYGADESHFDSIETAF